MFTVIQIGNNIIKLKTEIRIIGLQIYSKLKWGAYTVEG